MLYSRFSFTGINEFRLVTNILKYINFEIVKIKNVKDIQKQRPTAAARDFQNIFWEKELM